jgi:hypothetical protein
LRAGFSQKKKSTAKNKMSNIGLRVLSRGVITNVMSEAYQYSRRPGRPRTERHHRQRHRQHGEKQRMWHAGQNLCNAHQAKLHDRDHHPVNSRTDDIGHLSRAAPVGIAAQSASASDTMDGT